VNSCFKETLTYPKDHSRKQKPTKIERKYLGESILKKLKFFFTYRSEMGVQKGRNLQKKKKNRRLVCLYAFYLKKNNFFYLPIRNRRPGRSGLYKKRKKVSITPIRLLFKKKKKFFFTYRFEVGIQGSPEPKKKKEG
jgi:hypothetical protein